MQQPITNSIARFVDKEEKEYWVSVHGFVQWQFTQMPPLPSYTMMNLGIVCQEPRLGNRVSSEESPPPLHL